MSSGTRWNEDYSDPDSEIHRLGAVMAGLGSLDEFVDGMARESEPDTVCRYNSGETQAPGSLLVSATGRSITDYMQEKLCEPLGMTGPGASLLDRAGMEPGVSRRSLIEVLIVRPPETDRDSPRWRGEQGREVERPLFGDQANIPVVLDAGRGRTVSASRPLTPSPVSRPPPTWPPEPQAGGHGPRVRRRSRVGRQNPGILGENGDSRRSYAAVQHRGPCDPARGRRAAALSTVAAAGPTSCVLSRCGLARNPPDRANY